jgi:putative DNA methylase
LAIAVRLHSAACDTRSRAIIPAACKRLIEVDFPIAAVSAYSAREKSIRHGHPSTLHLWWARRPLAACRAILLGLLLPDPCDKECPASFKSAACDLLAKRYGSVTNSDAELRELLLKFIGEFASWDHAANALYLEIGRGLVKAAHPEETPVVVDPFAGGGSIPLEALRLGCETFASDLNPVACLILKTLLEDIPRYGNADFELADKDGKQSVVHGLADALRHVGRQVKEAAEKELAQFYPADPDGSRPIAYLWARTVRCEAVGCGAEIPLVRSYWLSKKAARKRALRYRVERQHGKTPGLAIEIFEPEKESDVPPGTVRRANATCPCCNVVLPAARVRTQLATQRGGADVKFDAEGHRAGGALLLAICVDVPGDSGRNYRLPRPSDYEAVRKSTIAVEKRTSEIPTEPSPAGGGSGAGRAFSVRRYGMQTFGDLFTARQKLNLTVLAEMIRALSKSTAAEQAVAEFAGLALSRFTDISNALCQWESTKTQVRHLFTRQAIPMLWDFAEADVFGDNAGNYRVTLETMARVVERMQSISGSGQVQQADACHSPLPEGSVSVWFTDPPYYDAVPYADLADFFYVWLRRVLPGHPLLRDPNDVTNPLTPKTAELVQDETKQSAGRPKDQQFFERGMGQAFREGRRVLREGGISCVVFAHKTTEGWEALLSGMISAGWTITASWPITTELGNRLRARDSAALAGSVHLVCRPREANAGVGDWSEVKGGMERRIREWLPTLLKHGIRGADAIFSCLGPALESYSKFERVLTAADREVPLGGDPDATEPYERGFLAYVFEALSKEALRQVLGDAETERFEEDARLTALFLWTLQATKGDGNGAAAIKPAEVPDEVESDDEEEKPTKAKPGFSMPFDTFIRITRPMGIHYLALEQRIIEIENGVVRLLPVKERTEQLLGEAAERPEIELSIRDFRQLELGLVEKKKTEITLPASRGRKLAIRTPEGVVQFTTLDRIHRAMLLFRLGRSTLLRQVLEDEQRKGKGFERLALALNALYPNSSEERRMLEGVQAAMRGIR